MTGNHRTDTCTDAARAGRPATTRVSEVTLGNLIRRMAQERGVPSSYCATVAPRRGGYTEANWHATRYATNAPPDDLDALVVNSAIIAEVVEDLKKTYDVAWSSEDYASTRTHDVT
jgi:hypothetical protein